MGERFQVLAVVEMFENGLAQAPGMNESRKWLGENAAELAQIVPSLRRVFPDIPPPLELPPQQRRRYLFQSVSEQIARAAQVRPQFAVIDDLQWADESTLALSIHMLNRIAQLPVVVIGTYRKEYSQNNPA